MLSFVIGIILGIVYFGGLYFTVTKMNTVKHPSILMTVSLILRMAILIVVFYYLAKIGYKNMLFALIGVIIVRILMTFRFKNQTTNSVKKE